MTAPDPVKSNMRSMTLCGLLTLGITFAKLIKDGLSLWGTAVPKEFASMPRASATARAAQPILEEAIPRVVKSQPVVAAIKAAAEAGAAASESVLPSVGSRIASAAGTVFGFSWMTMGVVGVFGALGGLYLYQRYWNGSGIHNANTNTTHVNVNIHFTGPCSVPIVEKIVDKNGTHLHMTMPNLQRA